MCLLTQLDIHVHAVLAKSVRSYHNNIIASPVIAEGPDQRVLDIHHALL